MKLFRDIKAAKPVIIAAFAFFLVLGLYTGGFFGFLGWGPRNYISKSVEATIIEKYVKKDMLYVVADVDGTREVLTCTDSWTSFNFDSGDDYANLVVGSRYTLYVKGYRVPVFSRFRNIVSYLKT